MRTRPGPTGPPRQEVGRGCRKVSADGHEGTANFTLGEDVQEGTVFGSLANLHHQYLNSPFSILFSPPPPISLRVNRQLTLLRTLNCIQKMIRRSDVDWFLVRKQASFGSFASLIGSKWILLVSFNGCASDSA